MAVIVGADGCRDGWVVVKLDTATSKPTADWITTQAISRLDFDVLAIDVPIGLPDVGSRQADLCARQFLRAPRASSVFPAPIRPALKATTRAEASTITQAADGRKVGVQAFAIQPKICAVDEILQTHAQLVHRVFEVHPEVSFAAWAGRAMEYKKKSAAGKQERQRLIAAQFEPGTFTALRESLRARQLRVPADDLADSFAALWSALRVHSGSALSFPSDAARDSTGLPMHIWY